MHGVSHRMVTLAALALLSSAWPVASRRLLAPRHLRTRAITAAATQATSTLLGGKAGVQPKLILTSSGLVTPKLEASFRRMLLRVPSSGNQAAPKIAMLVTAQMCGSGQESSSISGKRRSSGELRRRRWADARKKGKELEQQLALQQELTEKLQKR